MLMEEKGLYRLGRRSAFWAALLPSGHGLGQTWQFSVAARNRGAAKIVAPILETTALRSLGTLTIKGEAYPLLISWHEKCRGGGLRFGGARKTGITGGSLAWEMRWVPLADCEDGFRVEMRIQATPRGTGHLRVFLPTVLHQPSLWTLHAARGRGHCAQTVRSAYSAHAISFAALGGDSGWEETGGFVLSLPKLPLGGGKLIQFGLHFGAAKTEGDARAAAVKFYTAFADAALHSLESVTPLDPTQAACCLVDPAAYVVKGAERVYLLPPMKPGSEAEEETYYAGLPHEPIGAMKALWDRHRTAPDERIPRLVRFGAQGVCADFQVMGTAGEAEPNKGAFWDKLTRGEGRDEAGGLTHGVRSNARLARSLFQVHAATRDPLCRQSALNICHWLMLKQNAGGFYEGARTLATRGLPDDGRMLAQPCSLDGAEAIRAFTLAYKETGNEVWVKAAWRIADFLLEHRLREFDTQSPPTVAAVILSLLALDREAPNARLRQFLSEWGAWLRALPLSQTLPSLNADGFHAGLYECAEAGFALFGLTCELSYLRYAFSALSLVPSHSRAVSWRAVAAHSQALIALAALLPETRLDFDALSVTRDWRIYSPDPAAAGYLRVQPAGGEGWVEALPLVCRANDQLLLLLLAPPSVEAVTLWKNGRRPLVRDLLTDTLDTDTPLHFIPKEPWARVGLFTINS